MNRSYLKVLLFALAPAALSAQGGARRLAWLATANPDSMFADSLRAGRVRFLRVCGYSCERPGIGELTYAHCYAMTVPTTTIDPTGDVAESTRHAELKAKAMSFAARYNALTKAEVDRRGLRRCPVRARWDDYWHALDSLAKEVPAPRYQAWVAATVRGRAKYDFQLHVQDEPSVPRGVATRACALAPRFGILTKVRIRVTRGNVEHPIELRVLACERGVLLE